MSKRQYTKSPDLRQAKVGIGGCFGGVQRKVVLKKWSGNVPNGRRRLAPSHYRHGRKTGRAQDLSGNGKRIIGFCLYECRTVYSPPFPFDALRASRRRR